jgi:LemA protein
MNGITFITILIAIVGLFGLIYVSYYNLFQKYLIKINEVESHIDETLRDRFDLLGKMAVFIKEHTKEDVMTDLSTLEKTDLSSFDLERKLVSLTKEFYDLKFKHRELANIENFTSMDFTLRENEAQLDGYIAYYNDNISKYNSLIRMFPSNIIAKITHFKERTFYDGKDMTDKKTDDFKL